MKISNIKQLSKIAYFITGLLFIPQQSMANIVKFEEAYVSSVSTVGLKIEGKNNSEYVVSQQGIMQADIRVQIESSKRIKSFETWLTLRTENSSWQSFKPSGNAESLAIYKKTYKVLDRPKTVNKHVPLAVDISEYAKDACNAMAEQLRQDGLTDTAIFAIDRTLKIGVKAILDYELATILYVNAVSNFSIWEQDRKLTISCGKWSGAKPTKAKDLYSNADVKDAKLIIEEKTLLNGYCHLKLNGRFETSQAETEVTFRYHDNKGLISDLKTITTGASGKTFFTHHYDAPNNPDGSETGWIQMVGVSHKFESPQMNYEMNCSAGVTGLNLMQPPKTKVILATQEDYVEMPDKRLCPSKVRFVGMTHGNGQPFKGYTSLQVIEDLQEQKNHFSGYFSANAPATSWNFFGGFVVDINWNQSNSGGTLATEAPIGDTSKKLYVKVVVYDDEKNEIASLPEQKDKPFEGFKAFEAKCKTGPKMAVVSQPAQLKNLIPAQQTLIKGAIKKQIKTIGKTIAPRSKRLRPQVKSIKAQAKPAAVKSIIRRKEVNSPER